MSQRESESFVCVRVLERDQKDGGTRSAFRFFTCFLEPLLLAADSRGGNASFFFLSVCRGHVGEALQCDLVQGIWV